MIQSNFNSLQEWRKSDPLGYSAAYRHGLIDEICQIMGWENTKKEKIVWTKELCIIQALKFDSKGKWSKGDSPSYNAARENGWLPECCAHMGKIFWTKKLCIEDALKHRNRAEWNKNNNSAVYYARKHGFLDECLHQTNEVYTALKWTKEKCFEVASKHKNRSELSKSYPACYQAARKNSWLDEFFGVNEKNPRYTKEKCLGIALKYNTLTDWIKNDYGSYESAKKNGWLPECIIHMGKNTKYYWTKEKCIEEGLRYTSIPNFIENSSMCYRIAKKNGWLPECCVNIVKIKNFIWTKDKCIKDALKYDLRSKWYNRKSYKVAKENGWLDECTAHMLVKQLKWTKENCIKEALNYTHRHKWQQGSPGSYNSAKYKGWFDECVSHMEEYLNKPMNYWTKEKCIESALKYDYINPWITMYRGAYNASRRNDWFDECVSHMISRKEITKYDYTKEECINMTKNFKTFSNFKRNLTGTYRIIKKNGWLDDCCKNMEGYVK